jgi:alanyl-tRNA synthetase
MLGNWSFGDYFKREAIEWAWELVTEVWKFPKNRLYATVYKSGPGDPAEFDQEAYDHWARLFTAAGLDPRVQIVHGGKKDNFWMMGDTGPCGPCSEIHVDLTSKGDTGGALVNKGSAQCIEIWNLVFIQFNANPDGTFSALPAKHVDTGMGFERVTGILQNTNNFADFSRPISNYETDIFRPLFDQLEQMSGKRYGSTLPKAGSTGDSEQEKIDVAFRVIADHIRTLSFAIADGIQPGNNDRNYVLRRILRRAVRYGRSLGFREPFFYRLVDVLAENMGHVFPEIREKQKQVQQVIRVEEEAFNKTLDRGLALFEEHASECVSSKRAVFSGEWAFTLYDTYGFPYDLTDLLARERGLSVDQDKFNELMDAQRERARKAQKKEVIEVSQLESSAATRFVGFDQLETQAKVVEVAAIKDKTAVILEVSPFYAEMGGQVGDTGLLSGGGQLWRIVNTQKVGNTWLHFLMEKEAPPAGMSVQLTVDRDRRQAIQRHHTVTHLLHWALHEVVSPDAVQKGSYVGPEKLTFDFSSGPLTPVQVRDVEKLVNERILENSGVTWTEVPFVEVKSRKDIMQFFGDKYGDQVRVVQVGGRAGELDGYSMELCGGTHTRATGEVGLFRIVGEAAIAAGIRRIEALAGLQAYDKTMTDAQLIGQLASRVNSPVAELENKIESLLAQQRELEKQLKAMHQKEAAETARSLLVRAVEINGVRAIVENIGSADGDTLQAIADSLKGQFKGVIVLGGVGAGGAVAAMVGWGLARVRRLTHLHRTQGA